MPNKKLLIILSMYLQQRRADNLSFLSVILKGEITKQRDLENLSPVDTRRRFNGDTTSYNIVQRRIDVETTSCVYGELIFITHLNQRIPLNHYMGFNLNDLEVLEH